MLPSFVPDIFLPKSTPICVKRPGSLLNVSSIILPPFRTVSPVLINLGAFKKALIPLNPTNAPPTCPIRFRIGKYSCCCACCSGDNCSIPGIFNGINDCKNVLAN